MNLHKMIQIEADRLEKEVRELEKRLEKAPKGSLRCHKNGKNFRWYYIDEKDHREKEKNAKRKYISKRTGRSLAEKLARKAYDKKKLVGYKKELTALKRYLNCSNNEMMSERQYLGENSGFRELLISNMTLMDKELEEWRVADYPGNPFYPENLQICSVDGTMVRSKSESLIASGLASNGIPYRYEYPLDIPYFGIIYPDFTILDEEKRRNIIYEHFGLMDDENYVNKAISKIQLYASAGYILGDNLFITMETSVKPFDRRILDGIIGVIKK